MGTGVGEMFVTGLVLAAGGSSRLGQPKQLLPYKGRPLLDVTLAMARRCGFDQLLVTIGGSSEDVRDRVDFEGCEVVENVNYTAGCSSSIGAAIGAVDERSDGVVLLLGDQPDVSPAVVATLVRTAKGAPLGVTLYEEGRGHPFWFGLQVFGELMELHGDKAVWKLLESGRHPIIEARVAGPIPRDVDTWEDYQALLAASDEATRD